MSDTIIYVFVIVFFAFALWISMGLRLVSLERRRLFFKKEYLRKLISKRQSLIPLMISSAEKALEIKEYNSSQEISNSQNISGESMILENENFENKISHNTDLTSQKIMELKKGLISARARAMNVKEFNAERIEFEMELSEWINNFINFVNETGLIKKSAVYMHTMGQIEEIEEKTENASSEYSKSVMLFNKHISSPVNMVSVFLLRAKRENIFEFEK